MQTDTNFYGINLRVINYNQYGKSILYTDYSYNGAGECPVDVQQVVKNMLDGISIEFAIDNPNSDSIKNVDEVWPVIATLKKLELEQTVYGLKPILWCQIVIVDDLPYSPRDQKGDVYDNIYGMGFNVESFWSKLVESELPYTINVEELIAEND